MLLTGGLRLEFDAQRRVNGARNAVLAVDGRGRIVGTYDKAHLVPYGEYLPMRSLLEPLGLSRLVPGAVDFLPGPGPRTLDLGTFGKAGVQICYEIVFSGQVVDRANRPDYITNGSSDGWFGAAGPPQHFAQARLRAIEEGLPVLRSTPSGISGVIDAHGVVRQSLGMGEAGRIDMLIPRALPPTLFSRLGNMLGLGWAALFLLLAVVAMRQRPR
jgi:apolipoprotein N-acyltransferase